MFEGIAINFISAVLGAAILVFVNRAVSRGISVWSITGRNCKARGIAGTIRVSCLTIRLLRSCSMVTGSRESSPSIAGRMALPPI